MQAINIDALLLKQWPLPVISSHGDKEQRGQVLAIAGSEETPGAAVLAATASLHAGAGKLAVTTPSCIRDLVAQSLPEARVIGLHDWQASAAQIRTLAARNDAILVGPGMHGGPDLYRFVARLHAAQPATKLVLDAAALHAIKDLDSGGSIHHDTARCLMTPHAGEMAHLLGLEKHYVLEHAAELALTCAAQWQACVILKGAITYVAMPDKRLWKHHGADAGLATSGSGDVLAGLIAGLLARGACYEQAAAWGVAVHAFAGKKAGAARGATVGYLAREISQYAPALIADLSADD